MSYHYRQSATLQVPIVEERLANMASKGWRPAVQMGEPNDYLSWHIRLAPRRRGNTAELEPEMISRRLMPINFGAIHTTVFTITNCLFDLLATKSKGRRDGFRNRCHTRGMCMQNMRLVVVMAEGRMWLDLPIRILRFENLCASQGS